jgi:hypothetical protein
MILRQIGVYRVSQEECARLREGVPYVKVYRYNPKHLCPKLNGYCDTRCNACRRNLITGLTSAASPRVHISSTCKLGQKLGVALPLLTCSPSA